MPKSDIPLTPYVPFVTFENQTRKLAEKGQLPSRIDPTLLSHLAGGAQSQLLGAWRFFGLIDGDGKPSADLQKLAGDEKAWTEILPKLIKQAYSQQQLEQLQTGSPGSFAEAFNGSGSVRQKACRFLIVAATRAGMSVSPYLVSDSGRLKGFDSVPKSGKKRSKKPNGTTAPDPAPEQMDEPATVPSAGKKSYRFELRGNRAAELSWPVDITPSEIRSLWARLEGWKVVLEAEAKFRQMPDEEDEEDSEDYE